MQEQQLNRIIQKRIFWTFAGVTLFFLILLLLLLPYRLYTLDVYGARQNAREVSSSVEDGAAIASRILVMALERFESDASLALHCVRFFVERGHVDNARAVLERVLPLLASSASKELWQAYMELEFMFGTAASV